MAMQTNEEIWRRQIDATVQKIAITVSKKHELAQFKPCTFGDGGFYYHDGADRAICSCGWISAAIQRDKQALVALWKIHKEEKE